MNTNNKFTLTLDNDNRLHINNELVPDNVLENHGLNVSTREIANGVEVCLCVPTNGNEAIVPADTVYWNNVCADLLLDSISLTVEVAA